MSTGTADAPAVPDLRGHTVLALHAHPDDESIFMGLTLRRLADAGARTVLVLATDGDLGGSPRPWRLSTTGGWNWQPRLALADALDQAITDGPEFQEYFDASGVTGNDPEAFKKLPMH